MEPIVIQMPTVDIHRILDMIIAISFFLVAGTGTFFISKVREAVFGSIASRMRKHSRLGAATAEGHREINDILTNLREKFQASRVCLFQFHNGDNFMLSTHSWKLSCTYEILRAGTDSEWKQNQDLKVSAFVDWVGPIISDMKVEGVTELSLCTAEVKAECKWSKMGHKILRYDVKRMNLTVAQDTANKQGVGVAWTVNLIDPKRSATFGFITVQYQALPESEWPATERALCSMCAVAERVQFLLTTDFKAVKAPGFFRRLLGAIAK